MQCCENTERKFLPLTSKKHTVPTLPKEIHSYFLLDLFNPCLKKQEKKRKKEKKGSKKFFSAFVESRSPCIAHTGRELVIGLLASASLMLG